MVVMDTNPFKAIFRNIQSTIASLSKRGNNERLISSKACELILYQDYIDRTYDWIKNTLCFLVLPNRSLL